MPTGRLLCVRSTTAAGFVVDDAFAAEVATVGRLWSIADPASDGFSTLEGGILEAWAALTISVEAGVDPDSSMAMVRSTVSPWLDGSPVFGSRMT